MPGLGSGLCRTAGGYGRAANGSCRVGTVLAACLLEPPGADGKGQMVTACNRPGVRQAGGATAWPGRVAAGCAVCHACCRGVRCRTIPSQDRACSERGKEPARPGATPAACSSTGGRLAREAVHGAFMSHTPCVGCGWCCLSDQCQVSHRLHGYLPRCPELFWDAARGRYLCLLMVPPRAASALSPDVPGPDTSGPDPSGPDTFGPDSFGPDTSGPNEFRPDTSGPDLTELRQGLGCCAPLCSWRCDVRDRG